jgi:dihydroxy-acid dehydratase
MAVLRGNLAPGGAIIKQSAAAAADGTRRPGGGVRRPARPGRRASTPDLDVTADDMLVLKNIGPIGAPGMPEAGLLPIPRKLARARASRTWCASRTAA